MILLRRGLLNPVGEDMNILEQHSDSFASGDVTESTTITEIDLTKSAILLLGQKTAIILNYRCWRR